MAELDRTFVTRDQALNIYKTQLCRQELFVEVFEAISVGTQVRLHLSITETRQSITLNAIVKSLVRKKDAVDAGLGNRPGVMLNVPITPDIVEPFRNFFLAGASSPSRQQEAVRPASATRSAYQSSSNFQAQSRFGASDSGSRASVSSSASRFGDAGESRFSSRSVQAERIAQGESRFSAKASPIDSNASRITSSDARFDMRNNRPTEADMNAVSSFGRSSLNVSANLSRAKQADASSPGDLFGTSQFGERRTINGTGAVQNCAKTTQARTPAVPAQGIKAMQARNTSSLKAQTPAASKIHCPFEGLSSMSEEAVAAELMRTERAIKSGSLFTMFGITSDADRDKIRSVYNEIVRNLHPDSISAKFSPDIELRLENAYQMFNEAYQIIQHPVKREIYIDISRKEGVRTGLSLEKYNAWLNQYSQQNVANIRMCSQLVMQIRDLLAAGLKDQARQQMKLASQYDPFNFELRSIQIDT